MQNEELKLKGMYTFTKAKIETLEQKKLSEKISRLGERDDFIHSQKLKDRYVKLIRLLNSICKTEIYVCENLIPTVGRQMISNNLADSSPDNVMLINYTALGTGITAPANANTQLGTETYRKATASYTNSSNVSYITAFYTAVEVTGTFYEAGLFSNATGAANSGVLFSRVLLNTPTGIVKSGTESLTIDYTLTIS